VTRCLLRKICLQSLVSQRGQSLNRAKARTGVNTENWLKSYLLWCFNSEAVHSAPWIVEACHILPRISIINTAMNCHMPTICVCDVRLWQHHTPAVLRALPTSGPVQELKMLVPSDLESSWVHATTRPKCTPERTRPDQFVRLFLPLDLLFLFLSEHTHKHPATRIQHIPHWIWSTHFPLYYTVPYITVFSHSVTGSYQSPPCLRIWPFFSGALFSVSSSKWNGVLSTCCMYCRRTVRSQNLTAGPMRLHQPNLTPKVMNAHAQAGGNMPV
jgi:hypothetical protein